MQPRRWKHLVPQRCYKNGGFTEAPPNRFSFCQNRKQMVRKSLMHFHSLPVKGGGLLGLSSKYGSHADRSYCKTVFLFLYIFLLTGRKYPACRRCLPSLCALGLFAKHWMRIQPPLSHRPLRSNAAVLYPITLPKFLRLSWREEAQLVLESELGTMTSSPWSPWGNLIPFFLWAPPWPAAYMSQALHGAGQGAEGFK